MDGQWWSWVEARRGFVIERGERGYWSRDTTHGNRPGDVTAIVGAVAIFLLARLVSF